MALLKRAVIKEELVALTGDALSALILNQLLYWSERVRDFDAFIEEEKRRGGDPNIELTNGWIYKSAAELGEEIMMGVSEATIRRRLDDLVAAGYLDKRESPHKWDRTSQYRPNIYNIQRDLADRGYVLDGYPLQFRFDDAEAAASESPPPPSDDKSKPGEATSPAPHAAEDRDPSTLHREGSKLHSAGSTLHRAGSKLHSAGSTLHREGSTLHRDGTIPEITTETTTEITSENTNRNNNTRPRDDCDHDDGDDAPVAVAARARSGEAFEALRDLGMVPESLARQYARDDPDTAIRWADYARREGLGAAYVRKRLDGGDRPPPKRRRSRTTTPDPFAHVYR
jgi:hypothetical protein